MPNTSSPVQIKTVLCPVDFSSLSDDELQVAIEVCETFDARLVLHHNLTAVSPIMSKSWEWELDHPPDAWTEEMAEKAMRELMARVPATVRTEARVSRGLMWPTLTYLVDELAVDLLLLGSHGWSDDDHASLADRIVQDCPCPVMTIHDTESGGQHLHLRSADGSGVKVLVPIDFSKTADEAAAYAFGLARTIPLRLELLHVLSSRTPYQHVSIDDIPLGKPHPDSDYEDARGRLEAMVPEDLAGRVHCAVEAGSVVETVMRFAGRWKPELIVMGRHARGFLKHFLTRDTSRQLLHRASCPVWFPAAG